MSIDPERTIAALERTIREPRGAAALADDPDAWLAELGLDTRDRARMLACGPERLLAYQTMVHNRLRKTVAEFIPRTWARQGDDVMQTWTRKWVCEAPPRSPYLRRIPSEFVDWVIPRWQDEGHAAWLGELARYELLDKLVRHDERAAGEPTGLPLALDRPVACNGTLRILRFAHEVHALPRDLGDGSEPARVDEDDALLVFRGPDGLPHERTIRRRSSYLVEHLMAREPLKDALLRACERADEPLDDEILKVTAVTLADLMDAHVLLGATPE